MLRKISSSHIGILAVLICYLVALFYLVPTFNPGIVEPGLSNLAKHFAITYGLGTACTYFSRIFYDFEISIRFELVAGLFVTTALFVVIGPMVLKTA